MNRTKNFYKKKINLEQMSDEELLEFMDSVESSIESSDESFDSDDSVPDSTYILDDIKTETCVDDTEQIISECVKNMGAAETTDAFLQTINFSLNSSTLDTIPLAYSTFSADSQTLRSVALDEEPSSSKKALFKCKRARSPLPTPESTGPLVQPNAGGFIGDMKEISKNSKELSKLIWRKRSM